MIQKKLEIGICDDEPHDLERVHEALCRCMEILGEEDVSVYLFHQARELFEESRNHVFGLIFLDVIMPGWNGFDLASQLGAGKEETKVVFVSNHESMVFDSYDYTPLWFVRKSMLERDMLRALRKYQQTMGRKQISYRLKKGFSCHEVPLEEMMYIECEGHTLKVTMSDQRIYEVYGSLKPMEEELSKYGFVRIHKNYLVNQRYIREVGKKSIQLRNGSELDMGKARRKKIVEIMSQYEQEYQT